MSTASEKELDRALEHEIRNNPEFAAWFLGKTKFAGLSALTTYGPPILKTIPPPRSTSATRM